MGAHGVPLPISLYCLGALLLGAHFLRAENTLLTAVCVLTPLTFLYRRRTSLLVLQALAYGAAGVWADTAWRLVEIRLALGQNWALAVTILGAVALVSIVAGLLLNSRVMRERYPK